ncbi:MAG: MBL fold metallo-hydrolase, partial [Candidatus Bathyarchaeia archaeon]
MGKYVVVVILVVLTGILAAIFPYAQNTKGNERPLVTVLDTLYAADLDAEEIAICYLGGHAFLVRTQNHVILFDPEDKISPLDIHGIKRLDLLLITQRSIAPSEIETVRSICEKTTTVLANRVIHSELKDYVSPEKLREIHARETLSLSGLTVTAISSNGETDEWLMF